MTGGWGAPSWMGGDPVEGETFVAGKDQETARALLAACDEVGIDQAEVRTVNGGFIVPNAVWDAAQQASSSADSEF